MLNGLVPVLALQSSDGENVLTVFGEIVGILADLAQVLLFVPPAVAAAIFVYRRTARARRTDLTTQLGKLACGVTLRYVEDLLGPAAFRRGHTIMQRYGDRREIVATEWNYRTDYAWITTITDNETVIAFSLTIIDKRFHFATMDLSFEQYPVTLGTDTFAPLSHYDSRRLEIGARRFHYGQLHSAGNPGGYQYYYFAYNDASEGNPYAFSSLGGLGIIGAFADDPFSLEDSTPFREQDEQAIRQFRSTLTVSTLNRYRCDGV